MGFPYYTILLSEYQKTSGRSHLPYFKIGLMPRNSVLRERFSDGKKKFAGLIGDSILTGKQAKDTAIAGADVVVVGNAFEKNPSLIHELCTAVHSLNQK